MLSIFILKYIIQHIGTLFKDENILLILDHIYIVSKIPSGLVKYRGFSTILSILPLHAIIQHYGGSGTANSKFSSDIASQD